MNTWAALNHLQTGRHGEDFAKISFGRAGFDLFSPEVDDRASTSCCASTPTCRYYDVQFKTVRSSYVFMRKDKFRLTSNLLLALVIVGAGSEPEMYLIPANTWWGRQATFADRDYDGLKSAPEYGLTVSAAARMALLGRW